MSRDKPGGATTARGSQRKRPLRRKSDAGLGSSDYERAGLKSYDGELLLNAFVDGNEAMTSSTNRRQCATVRYSVSSELGYQFRTARFAALGRFEEGF